MDIGTARHVRLKLFDDAKILLNQLKATDVSSKPYSVGCDTPRRKIPTLTGCKKLVARKYYVTYKDGFEALDAIDAFADYNYASGAWRKNYDKAWRRSIHQKQIAALIEAESSGKSLKRCAEKYGVGFDGFHFSTILHMALFPKTMSHDDFAHPSPIDFTGISANGSFIERVWISTISSFSMCQLKEVKFYSGTSKGCYPGTNTYQMDFTGANLTGSDLRFSYLRGCNFTNAILVGTDFRDANLHECCFSGATGSYLSTTEDNEDIERLRYLNKARQWAHAKRAL